VAACLATLGYDSSSWQGAVAHRDNSRVHRAHGETSDIAIKECFNPKTMEANPALAQQEFGALRRVVDRTIASGMSLQVRVPVPLALCDEQATYAMSWMPGRSATEALLLSDDGDGPLRIGAAAGSWLRRFHALHPLPQRPPDFQEKIETVREIGRRAAGDPLIARTARALVARLDATLGVTMPASWIHGDMKSDNLLVEGESIAGLDLQIVDENVVAYDLAPFLNHLGLLRWSLKGATRGGVLVKAAEGFLRGYSLEAPAWSVPLAWLRAYLLMQMLERSLRARNLRARAAGWPVRAELRGVLATLEQP
jgi:Ser/Thr protein kinase RdoA (MazF antagonist)